MGIYKGGIVMNTKEQIEQCIASLEWLKFNIFGTEEPKKNTFEYAAKVYLENAIALLKDQESDEILDIIIKKRVNIGYFYQFVSEHRDNNYEQYLELRKINGVVYAITQNEILTETEFNKIKERLVK